MSVRLVDIAKKTGYSVSTVSRALHGNSTKYKISEETIEKIQSVADELGYRANELARGLKSRKTHTLGLVIPDISNPFFSSISRSVEREARKSGYSVILCDTEEKTSLEIDAVQLLQGRNVEGLIVAPVGQICEHLEIVYKSGLPIVTVDRYFPQKDFPFVTSDNYKGAYDAVLYLIENGHTKIACIRGLKNTTPNDHRIRGYKDALSENNIPVVESLIVGNSFGEQNGYTEAKILLKLKKRPTAIFAFSNLITLGALKAIEEENLSVPEDLSIVAFDDQPYFDHLATPISSVAQQNIEIGQIATKIICNQIKSKTSSFAEGVIIPTKLIKRASVKRIQQSIYYEKELV